MAASLGLLAACSGINEINLDEKNLNQDGTPVERVIFEAPVIRSLGEDDGTRASLSQEGDKAINFGWEATDTVGIYPDSGAQVYFSMSNGVGTNIASFEGGGWALRQESTYSCYYPFVGNMYLKRDAIPVSFVHQVQKGVSNYEGVHFILASEGTSSSAGTLRFNFNMLNTVIRIKALGLPAGTYTKLTLTVGDPLFVQEGTFGLEDMTLIGKTYSNTLEISLEDFVLTETSTETNPVLIYLASAPVDLSGKTVTIRVFSDNGRIYKCQKTPSKAYEASAWGGLKCEMKKQTEIIQFADPEVKRICVENWDDDGDGELDRDEAASVTSLGTVFRNTGIVSFDELAYFMNLESIPEEAFRNCSGLTSITLPESIVRIEDYAFFDCPLESVVIPTSVTNIGGWAFHNAQISSLIIPDSVQSIGPSAFALCHFISSIHLGNAVTNLGENAFGDIYALEAITVGNENPKYDSRNNCNAIIETDSNTLVLGSNNTIIPDSVTRIGNSAFHGHNITSIIIPDSVTSIGVGAFYDASLSSVVIPESVTRIEDYAFMGCASLTSITVLAITPPVLGSIAFDDHFDLYSYLIYVPSESVSTYKNTEGWIGYADRIQGMQGGIVDPIGGEEE